MTEGAATVAPTASPKNQNRPPNRNNKPKQNKPQTSKPSAPDSEKK
jgi:hypothetical protein